jgi:hypothetical protein
MATTTVTIGHNAPTGFVSGDEVRPDNLNALGLPTVTVSNIVNADISASAAIAASKLAGTLDLSGKTVTLPSASVNALALATDAVETAKIDDAAVTAPKLSGAQAGNAPVFGVRAWVNFNGKNNTSNAQALDTTNRYIRAKGNVASVLRNAIGDYTINFTTAMQGTDYAVLITTCGESPTNSNRIGVVKANSGGTGPDNKTTSQVTIITTGTASAAEDDLADINVMIIE